MASPAFNFIEMQYQFGKISEEQLQALAEQGRITQDEYKEIISQED